MTYLIQFILNLLQLNVLMVESIIETVERRAYAGIHTKPSTLTTVCYSAHTGRDNHITHSYQVFDPMRHTQPTYPLMWYGLLLSMGS